MRLAIDPRPWLVFAGLVLAALPAPGQEPAPPLPERNPAPSAQPATDAAEPAPEEEPDLPGEQPTVAGQDTEVGAAQTACVEMLDGVRIDYELLDPIRKGLCGAPAPILVTAIGADPAVVISPPATMRCTLALALATWVKETLQPAASVLGSRVVKMRNASSYKCRNRYGGANTTISEHARANAFDVSEFVLASGQRIKVEGNWPYGAHIAAVPHELSPPIPNPRRIAAALAREEAAASSETTGAVISVSTRPSVTSAIVSLAKAKTNPFVEPSSQAAAQRLSPVPRAAPSKEVSTPIATIMSNPFVSPVPKAGAARLEEAPEPVVAGEPETKAEAPPELPGRRTVEQDEVGAFLRAIHADACRTFETVLGPEANAAHKDHFHFDMKMRRYVKICDTAVRN